MLYLIYYSDIIMLKIYYIISGAPRHRVSQELGWGGEQFDSLFLKPNQIKYLGFWKVLGWLSRS